MKVVINADYGGFGISDEAFEMYLERTNQPYFKYDGELFGFGTDYLKVPKEEYERVLEEDKNLPVREGRYDRSNALYYSKYDIERTDPVLISLIEELGEDANGVYSSLKIVEVPDDVDWIIQDYDGIEWVAEKHRTWS